jgi:D-alanine-D-alanine ligase
VVTQAAKLTPELEKRFARISKHIYQILHLSGYARIDYRLTEDGRIYVLEANPNPQIARNEDFAQSAKHSGLNYEPLLQKILTLGLSYSSNP